MKERLLVSVLQGYEECGKNQKSGGVFFCVGGGAAYFCTFFFNRGVRELTRRFAEFFLVRGSFFATCGGGGVALRGRGCLDQVSGGG